MPATRPWYKIWPEAILLIFSLAWVPLLPRPALLCLSRTLGSLGYRFSRRLRLLGEANLDFAFGKEKTEEEKLAILRATFQHFALVVADIVWFSFRTRARVEKYVVFDESCGPTFETGGKLFLTGHYGNWEINGLASAHVGHPVMSIAAALKNPIVNDLFIRIRERTGQVILPQQGAARGLLKGLKNGNKIAVLLDQNTHPRDGGIFVDYFGTPVCVSSAPAALAIKVGVQTVAVTCVPDNRGIYTVHVHEVIEAPGPGPNAVARLTQAMTSAMERVVRAQPQYWLWMYKRWRHIPDGADPSHFPDYARPLKKD